MHKLPIGYRSKIRRKRPGLIIFALIVLIAGITLILFNVDLNNLKDFYVSSNEEELTQIPSTVTVKSNNTIQVNDTIENNSYINKNLVSNEQIPEDLIFPEEIKETDDTSNEQILKLNQEIFKDKKDVTVIDTKKEANVDSDSNAIKKEKNNLESKNLRSISDKSADPNSEDIKSELKKDKYHIIISSVESKEAAEKQQKIFSAMSIKTDIIYIPSKNRYRLSLGTFSSFKEASSKSKTFQSKHTDYKTWVWKEE